MNNAPSWAPQHFIDGHNVDQSLGGRGWMQPVDGHPLHLSIVRSPEPDMEHGSPPYFRTHHIVVALIEVEADGHSVHERDEEEAVDISDAALEPFIAAMVAKFVPADFPRCQIQADGGTCDHSHPW